jgi:hypothetical protein
MSRPARSIRRLTIALIVAAPVALPVIACGRPAPATPASTVASASAPARCAALASCGACAAEPACRWCTEPHGCVRAGEACNGLALAHPSTCGNDPALGGDPRRDAIAASRASYLYEIADFSPAGPAVEARLDTLTSFTIPVEAARCFSLLWSVSADAKLRPVSLQFDFVAGSKIDVGVIGLTPAGWSGRTCSSVAGTLRVTVVNGDSQEPFASAGTGRITFELYARARTASDPDHAAIKPAPRPIASAPGASPPIKWTPPAGGSVGVDCLDCTFPCESSRRDCERRCFVAERDDGARRGCEKVCEQIERACLRGCPGC